MKTKICWPVQDLPEDQAQRVDVALLVALKVVPRDGAVEHLGGEVALRAHAHILRHVDVVAVGKVSA